MQVVYPPVFVDRASGIGIAVVQLPRGWTSLLTDPDGNALPGAEHSEFRGDSTAAFMDGAGRLEAVKALLRGRKQRKRT
jgi:hypothetical protein